jgi:hypothetical protein
MSHGDIEMFLSCRIGAPRRAMPLFEHLEKRQIPIKAGDRLSAYAATVVIGLCALAAWGLVLGLGVILLRISG